MDSSILAIGGSATTNPGYSFYVKGIGGRKANSITYVDVKHNDKHYVVGFVKHKKEHIPFVFDKEDSANVIGKSWHKTCNYMSFTGIEGKPVYLHNVIMDRMYHEGKGATITVDHINRNGYDNRKENLRLATQTEQNINQRTRTRTIVLPTNCGITPEEIPKHIWYIKANGKHGDRFAVELASEGIIRKTTSSKKVSLREKLDEAKEIQAELYAEYPHLDPENPAIVAQVNALNESFEMIVTKALGEAEISDESSSKEDSDKDKYYTLPLVAANCILDIQREIPDWNIYTWIEPSAGNGSFLRCTPPSVKRIYMDLEPADPSIPTADFLTWKPIEDPVGPFIVFGNPPFGHQSSTAKAFIRHAASFADVIAFILPRSFTKPSMTRAFPPNFHCLFSKEIPSNAFTHGRLTVDVSCVFQIWRWKETPREVVTSTEPIGFRFVSENDTHDIIVRKIGSHCGRAILSLYSDGESASSYYFIKLDEPEKAKAVVTALNIHVFPHKTLGANSLAKHEIAEFLNPLFISTP